MRIHKILHLTGLLPLLILTKDGATHEVVEEVIAGIEAAEKQDLLPITKLLASLVFTSESDKEWIIWRFNKMSDILRETWAYQEIVQEGELRALHQALLAIVQRRFPEIIDLTKKQIDDVVEPESLQDLLVNISLAQNVQDAIRALFALEQTERRTDTDHDVPTMSE